MAFALPSFKIDWSDFISRSGWRPIGDQPALVHRYILANPWERSAPGWTSDLRVGGSSP
jgi:hypothetical protein